MKTKKCAVIGIGGMGKNHANWIQATKRLELVAVVDANESLRVEAARQWPAARFYTKPSELYAKEQIDLVIGVVPHNLHAPLAIEALNAGVNVLVEKPMATTYEDCCAMIKAAKDNGKLLTVFHNRRLDGWFVTARSVIRQGLLGNIVAMTCSVKGFAAPDNWRGRKKDSGGVMFDWGCHLIDYLLHFDESDVKAVSGHFYTAPDADPSLNEDHGTLRIYFASGAVGNLTVSTPDRHTGPRYHIVGTKGTLVDEWNWQPTDPDTLQVMTDLPGGETTSMKVTYAKCEYLDFFDNLAAALFGEGAPLVDAASAARVINVLQTAERSHAKGGIPLPLA